MELSCSVHLPKPDSHLKLHHISHIHISSINMPEFFFDQDCCWKMSYLSMIKKEGEKSWTKIQWFLLKALSPTEFRGNLFICFCVILLKNPPTNQTGENKPHSHHQDVEKLSNQFFLILFPLIPPANQGHCLDNMTKSGALKMQRSRKCNFKWDVMFCWLYLFEFKYTPSAW